MASYIPDAVQFSPLDELIMGSGLELEYMGKVRNCYCGLEDPELRLMVVTDRRSIFDFVLGFTVPGIGKVLNALNIYWSREALRDFNQDLTAVGCGIDRYIPDGLRGNVELRSRATIVKRGKIIPIEAIVRGYLVGSGWEAYQQTGEVCGHQLPEGLWEGCQLPKPIFTPSTKAVEGHDLHMSYQQVRNEYPWLEKQSLWAYRCLNSAMVLKRYRLADTKFEWLEDGTLADERGTPDSSRIWSASAWEEAQEKRKAPSANDKQFLRDAGKWIRTPFGVTGLHQLDPANPEHQKFAGSVEFSRDVIEDTGDIYMGILMKLTGFSLTQYLVHHLNIAA